MNINEIREIAEVNGYNEEYINQLIIYASRITDNNLPVIFDKEHFARLTGYSENIIEDVVNRKKSLYRSFFIPKKNGGRRLISTPKEPLKALQKMILVNILNKVKTSEYCHGFKYNSSIVTNARVHVGQKVVYNIDIKDFFPSIKQHQIKKMFMNFGYTDEVSILLASICCLRGCLPQGAPSSPMLSNIICNKLDMRLGELTKSYKINYSRYADDLTFSGGYVIKKKRLTRKIKEIIFNEGFIINKQKENFFHSNMRQTVTGLVVNNKVSVPREYLNKIRQEIYYATKFGPNKHIENLLERDKIDNFKSNFRAHIYGKVFFINSVNEELANRLLDVLNGVNWEDGLSWQEDSKI